MQSVWTSLPTKSDTLMRVSIDACFHCCVQVVNQLFARSYASSVVSKKFVGNDSDLIVILPKVQVAGYS